MTGHSVSTQKSTSFEIAEGSSSTSSTGHTYDIFLSFRGEDTRNSFTDHLHTALNANNIDTFLDDKKIDTGEDLKQKLRASIKVSKASVIVLSENYANSTWCLNELVLILEQHKVSNHIVFPIFYHVEPTHIRKQEKSFGDAMADHKKKMDAERDDDKRSELALNIDLWKEALTVVGELKGDHIDGSRPETGVIKKLVDDIYTRLRISSRIDLPQLIGRDNSKNFVTSWLKDKASHTVDILTISGMGGIGKTTLAKYVYGSHSHEFDTSSFIEDISKSSCEQFNGLLDLQKQLCNDILKPSSVQVNDVKGYIRHVEKAVTFKKVFLVLDGVDSIEQLDALLGSKCFHPGSKIIITTEYARLTERCTLFQENAKSKHKTFSLLKLHDITSRELLCYHAFKPKDPKEGYEKVLEEVVKYCQGNPMALKSLGRSLRGYNVAHWEWSIQELMKEKDKPLDNVLKMSFESLPFNDDREVFKHIACFFVGMDKDITETILNACRINSSLAFTNLAERCLISIGWNNKLVMHRLLRAMGRYEVHKESPDKPWKRSRLWSHEDSFQVLKDKKGKGSVRGLTLDMTKLQEEKLEFKTSALNKMDNLMLLQLNYVTINGPYDKFPRKLRWLCMHGFSLTSIPSDLNLENLVALDMSCSKIESFGICCTDPQQVECRLKLTADKRSFGSLKILNLSSCEQLHSLGSFDQLPALERLIVRNCSELVCVCESIKACVELVLIDLSNCKKLEKLPTTIDMLKKVKTLLADGCSLKGSRIETASMDSLEILKANNTGINLVTSSSEAIPVEVDFTVISIPKTLVKLSLANNKLSTESFPVDFNWISTLKELYLDDNPIVSLPNCVRSLPSLEILSISNCKKLMYVEHLPHKLTKLTLYSIYKPSLRKVVFLPEMSPLRLLIEWKSFAPSLFEFQGIIKVQPIVNVEENLLTALGWTDLDFLKKGRIITPNLNRGSGESEIQMYYQFGIFSTIYGGEKMPSWINDRSKGPSILLTIPPTSPNNNLIGLNFCSLQRLQLLEDEFFYVPMVNICNITKKRTWMYQHYIDKVSVGGGFLVLLSHWMFGKNEMEAGDEVIVTVTEEPGQIRVECGVSLVYDDGKTDEEEEEEEEEDVLGYYKSWNHIIGGDLSPFETQPREYILNTRRFMLHADEVNHDSPIVGEDTSIIERDVWFRALSQKEV